MIIRVRRIIILKYYCTHTDTMKGVVIVIIITSHALFERDKTNGGRFARAFSTTTTTCCIRFSLSYCARAQNETTTTKRVVLSLREKRSSSVSHDDSAKIFVQKKKLITNDNVVANVVYFPTPIPEISLIFLRIFMSFVRNITIVYTVQCSQREYVFSWLLKFSRHHHQQCQNTTCDTVTTIGNDGFVDDA